MICVDMCCQNEGLNGLNVVTMTSVNKKSNNMCIHTSPFVLESGKSIDVGPVSQLYRYFRLSTEGLLHLILKGHFISHSPLPWYAHSTMRPGDAPVKACSPIIRPVSFIWNLLCNFLCDSCALPYFMGFVSTAFLYPIISDTIDEVFWLASAYTIRLLSIRKTTRSDILLIT